MFNIKCYHKKKRTLKVYKIENLGFEPFENNLQTSTNEGISCL